MLFADPRAFDFSAETLLYFVSAPDAPMQGRAATIAMRRGRESEWNAIEPRKAHAQVNTYV